MLNLLRRQRGISLVELAIGMVLLGILLALAAPAYSTWIQNVQVRTAAEAVKNGLQLARTEALRRNQPVQFHLVDRLDASCTPSASGPQWVVSLKPVAGKCDVAPSEETDPQIVQKRDNSEGSAQVAIQATQADGTSAATVIFDTLGRVQNADAARRVDLTSPNANRPLRVRIGPSGETWLCDPKLPSGDPHGCREES